MKNKLFAQVILFFCFLVACFSFTPYSKPSVSNHLIDSTNAQKKDTVWNVIVHVEFGVDSNGKILDVVAEELFECFQCDSTIINDLKNQAVATVKAMSSWSNRQGKYIRYKIPVSMVRTKRYHTKEYGE